MRPMPSPIERDRTRTRIRDLISQCARDEIRPEALSDRLHDLAVEEGRAVADTLATLAIRAMRDLRAAVPGAQLGGIAGELQRSVKRFGEPYSSMIMAFTESLRLSIQGTPEAAERAMKDAWRRWGPDVALVGAMSIVVLYGQIASARGGIGLAQAWADAAEIDEEECAARLAAPLTQAEQRLWDSGFTEREIRTLTTRLQTLAIGVDQFGNESASFADLATTPERQSALLGMFEAIKAGRRKKGS